jgi:YD repeat-containing protein
MKYLLMVVSLLNIISCKNEVSKKDKKNTVEAKSTQAYLILPQEYYHLIDDLYMNNEMLIQQKVKTYAADFFINGTQYKKIIHNLTPKDNDYLLVELIKQNKKMDTVNSIKKLSNNLSVKKMKLANGKTISYQIQEKVISKVVLKQIEKRLNDGKNSETEIETFENELLKSKKYSKVNGTETYTYNSQKQLITGTYEVENKGIVRSFNQTYGQSNITRQYTKGSNETMKYVYDTKGSLTSIEWTMTKNATTKVSFFYNEKNLLVKRLIQSTNKNFINSETRYTYQFN